jgi:uncharacterized protein YcbK (DUF882 family)
MYIPKWFKIYELVPPDVFEQKGKQAWEFLDDRLLITLDRLRGQFGPMTVNNYMWGGPREWSGLRTVDSPYYWRDSQHTFGRAADCLFHEIDVEHIRTHILRYPNDPRYEHIGGIELDTSWLHIDVRNTERIKTFYPN